jgi:3-hydroxy-9,10-secoandrosta-1,3,5(10)-triene-9,17-dione monooxygenase
LERASALAPVLRDRARDTNEARRLPESTIADFWEAGLFHLLKPRTLGGQETPLDIVLRITAILARGDGSAAWVWNSLILHEWVGALLPHEGQQEFWAKEDSLAASSFAANGKLTPVDGGYNLSGKWSFCSGVDCANWIFLGAKSLTPDADPLKPDIRWVLVPTSDCRVIDDWHVLGLRGTGSKSVAVHNAFVPEHRTMRYDDLVEGLSPGGKIHASPLYRAPVWTVFPLGICAPAVGIAQGACESFIREFKTRVYGIDYQAQAKNPSVQLRLAEASALIDAADLLYQRSLTHTVGKIMAGETLSMEDRVRSRRDQGYSVQMSMRAVELLLAAQGGKGLYDASHIQRALCDLHGISAHIMGGWDMPALNFGQVILSGTPANPFY